MSKGTIELNEREISLLRVSLYERRRAIRRKRSWRLSEQAVAIADVNSLEDRLIELQNKIKETEGV